MTLRPLFAYIPWHAKDASVRTAAPALFFAVLTSLPLYGIAQGAGVSVFSEDPQFQATALQIWGGVITLCITIGSLLFMSQTVATDREKQYVKFLFAHQVSPLHFYVQRFVVGLALLAAWFTIIPLAFSQIVPVPVLGTLLALLVNAVFVGALALLCAVVTNKDGALLIGVYLISSVTQQITAAAADAAPRWIAMLSWILPPINQLGGFTRAWTGGRTVEPSELVLVAGYGIGMLVTALFLIRRAPLVR